MVRLSIFFWLLLMGIGLAATPITIHSERMEVLENQKVVVFTGRVVAQKKDLTLYSDRLIVYYQSHQGHRQVVKMIALGHVKILKDHWIAHSGKAVYFKREEKIVLEDNPRVWHGQNVVRGDRITLYLNEDRSVVEAAPGHKTEAVVFTD